MTSALDQSKLQRIAAGWFLREGQFGEAFELAAAAEDWAFCVTLVDERATELLVRSEVAPLLSWLSQLPESAYQQYVAPNLVAAWCAGLHGGAPDATRRVRQCKQQLAQRERDGEEPSSVAARRISLAAAEVFIDSRAGRVEQSGQGAQKALEGLPPGQDFLQGLLLMQSGYAQVEAGEYGQAVAQLEEAVALLMGVGNFYGALTALAYHARALRLSGSRKLAQAVVGRAMAYAQEHHLTAQAAAGSVLLEHAELLSLEGNPVEAEQHLEEATQRLGMVAMAAELERAQGLAARLTRTSSSLSVQPRASAPTIKGTLLEALSPRELEVLHQAAEGLSNRQIGERLFVSVGTVKTHLHHILGKLNVRNRTAAVARARELGLLAKG